MKTDLYSAQAKLDVCHSCFPPPPEEKALQLVVRTAMLISSRGQFGLNVARLEEGQRLQPLPGREQEGPTAVTQL